MDKHFLTEPIEDEALSSIRAGDLVYYTGTLFTARDHVHLRVVKEKRELPVDLKGGAIFHAGPIMRSLEDHGNRYEVISIGPTTSMRMESLEAPFIEKTGIKLMIGKGGMGERTTQACRIHRCLHAVFPGGCAVLAASKVVSVKGVHWLDLGMPEAIWEMEVKEFGPLLVSIDSQGNNLFQEQAALYQVRKEEALLELDRFLRRQLEL